MAEHTDREELSAALEAVIEAERDTASRSGHAHDTGRRPRPAASGGDGGTLLVVEDDTLPPIRRSRQQPRGVGDVLTDELGTGPVWRAAWVVVRETVVLALLFWVGLLLLSLLRPDGVLHMGGTDVAVWQASLGFGVAVRLVLAAVAAAGERAVPR